MRDEDKTKAQLIKELAELRQRITRLESPAAGQQQAEMALRQGEERYRSLVQTIPYGIQEIDLSGRIIYANEAHYQIHGYAAGELIGTEIFDLQTSEAERRDLREYLAVLAKDQPPPTPYEAKKLTKDGSIIDVQVDWNYKRDEKGQVTGFISVITAVTERKQAEEELRKYRDHLEELVTERTAELTRANEQLEQVNKKLTGQIAERKRAEQALRESEEQFHYLADAALEAIFINQEGICLLANQAAADMFGYQLSELIGMFGTDFIAPESHQIVKEHMLTGSPEPYEVLALRKDGSTFPAAIKAKTMLYKGETVRVTAVRDITEQVEIKERFRLAAEVASDVIYEWTLATDRLEWFGNIDQWLGYKPGQFPRTLEAWWAAIHPDDQNRLADSVERHRKLAEPIYEEYRVQRQDGAWLYWTDRGTPVLDSQGRPYKWIGVCTDITERKQVEEALRESENLYRLLAENVTDVIWTMNMNMEFTYFSPSVTPLRGYSVEEATAQPIYESMTPDSLEIAMNVFREELEVHHQGQRDPGRSVALELELTCKDGSTLWAEIKMNFMYDSAGQPIGIIGVTRDIAERKQAEEALRASEEKYRQVVERANDIITIIQDTLIQYVNPQSLEILGYSPQEVTGTALNNYVHPDELQKAVDRYRRRMAGQAVPQIYETALVHKNGRRVEVEVSGGLINYQGKAADMVIIRDITERKRTEEALAEERNLLRTLIDNLPDFIYVKDTESRLVLCNTAARRVLGVKTPDEFIGKTDFDFYPQKLAAQYYADEREVFRSGQALTNREEPLMELASNRRGWLLTTKAPLRDSRGKIIGIVGIGHDISERKQAREALRESEERYRMLFEQANDAILVSNIETDQIIDVNRQAGEMLGYTREELLTMKVPDLQAPEFRGQEGSVVKGELERYGGAPFETINIHRDGTPVPVEVSISRMTGTGGELALGIVRDITERKQAEEALQRRNGELALLNQVGQTFVSSLDMDQVLGAVLEEMRRLLDAVACSVWLVDPETDDPICRQASGLGSEAMRGWRLSPGEGLVGWVARHGQSLIVPDTRADERHFKGIDQQIGLELRSILSAPLRIKQKTIGVIQVLDTAVGRFDPPDLMLVESLAATAAIAIENARLYEQAQQNVKTKAMLLNEVNHRVGNNLTLIMAILGLEMQRSFQGETDFRATLQDIRKRIGSMAAVHKTLSATQWAPLSLNDLVAQIIRAALSGSPIRRRLRVTVMPSAKPLWIAPKQAIAMALIVNELTTNSIKYAFQDRDRGRIEVQITAGDEHEQQVKLEFRDDGPGWPDDVLSGQRQNVGLNLVRLNVRSPLRGQVALRNDNGAVALITFKLASPG